MMDVLFVFFIFIGFLMGMLMYKYMIKRQQLSLFIAVLPYIALGLLSAPSLYPQLEEWRVVYFWGMMTFLLTCIIKERIEIRKAKLEKSK